MHKKQHTEENKTEHYRRDGRKLNIILGGLLVIALAVGIFWYVQYHRSVSKNPANEQRQWTSELSKIMVMPNEQPLITTVLDKSKLTNETLVKQAQNGDRLYIFSKAKQLVLYRPSSRQVVNILAIQTGAGASDTASKTATGAATTPGQQPSKP